MYSFPEVDIHKSLATVFFGGQTERRRNQSRKIYITFNHTQYIVVKCILYIWPFSVEQSAAIIRHPGTNSRSKPVPQSRLLTGELTYYVFQVSAHIMLLLIPQCTGELCVTLGSDFATLLTMRHVCNGQSRESFYHSPFSSKCVCLQPVWAYSSSFVLSDYFWECLPLSHIEANTLTNHHGS